MEQTTTVTPSDWSDDPDEFDMSVDPSEDRCDHCGKPFDEFGDLGCGHCDRRHPEFGLLS